MPLYVDLYFSDHDLTAQDMTDLEAGTPVSGVTSRRVAKRFQFAGAFHTLGRDPLQARIDANNAILAIRSASSWNGTRVAAIRRDAQ